MKDEPAPIGADGATRLTAWVRGEVQGVGFRWWVRVRALELGLTGSARNLGDGRVEVVAEGGQQQCRRLLEMLGPGMEDASRPGRVSGASARWSRAEGNRLGFEER